MTWVKICGITNLEDALVAVEAGADAVGFVFYDKSPRYVNTEAVEEIVKSVPPRIEKVGVFVNQQEEFICHTADKARLTAVQMHGDNEDPHVADLVVAKRPLKVLAGISMHRAKPEGWAMLWDQQNVYAFLADSGNSATFGGTGEPFDWRGSVKSLNSIKTLSKLVLAGGLAPTNVASAMEITKPWGVDVSSGVEARPGKKDPEKVRAFIRAVRVADRANSNN